MSAPREPWPHEATERIHQLLGQLAAKELELRRLEEGIATPADEAEAVVSWRLAKLLFAQIEQRDQQCAYWVVSALSKLAAAHPRRRVIEVLALARTAMPIAQREYRAYVKDKS